MHHKDLPKFKDMPAVKGMPHGTAWGLWDKNGVRDNCGTLNLLTPENTIEAQKEIRSGKSIALNWRMDNIKQPGFSREECKHNYKDLKPLGFFAWDDLLHINTQSGSQWDGFRHWGHQETGLYYNNLPHDHIPQEEHKSENSQHHWSERGGIVGRGVLIDYVAYAERHNIKYSPTTRHCISISDIEAIAKEQNVTFKPCDILLVCSGFVKWYEGAPEEEQISGATNGHEFVGVEGTEEAVEWLWDHHFAAVAGDAIAFEAWPPKAPFRLHDHFLAMWGTPIGELWNLEELAEVCAREKKYSFFVTSASLNIYGGIASPPNVLAIM